MKEIKLFMTPTCPHCKRALAMIEELYAEHPEYKQVPLAQIDENAQADYAATFDYYYIPTCYVGDEKCHEGVPSKEAIQEVFEKALKE